MVIGMFVPPETARKKSGSCRTRVLLGSREDLPTESRVDRDERMRKLATTQYARKPPLLDRWYMITTGRYTYVFEYNHNTEEAEMV